MKKNNNDKKHAKTKKKNLIAGRSSESHCVGRCRLEDSEEKKIPTPPSTAACIVTTTDNRRLLSLLLLLLLPRPLLLVHWLFGIRRPCVGYDHWNRKSIRGPVQLLSAVPPQKRRENNGPVLGTFFIFFFFFSPQFYLDCWNIIIIHPSSFLKLFCFALVARCNAINLIFLIDVIVRKV